MAKIEISPPTIKLAYSPRAGDLVNFQCYPEGPPILCIVSWANNGFRLVSLSDGSTYSSPIAGSVSKFEGEVTLRNG